jgi:Fur family ferric uptake transcriptional regulator
MDSLDILKSNSLKVTECRMNLLEIIKNSDAAMSAKELYKVLIEKGSDLEYSTVYRTINLFIEKGIFTKYDMKDGKYYYKLRETHHTHKLKCEVCHKEMQIECPLEEISQKIYKETGYSLDCKDIDLKATCRGCKIKNSNNDNNDKKDNMNRV